MAPTSHQSSNSHTDPNRSYVASERHRDLLNNAVALLALWAAYSAIRTVTADQFSTAIAHASQLLRFQDTLGLPHEGDLQRVLIDQDYVIKAANIYYVAMHFPVTLGFLGWVWHKHRDALRRVRNALITVTAAGLIIHVAFPLAPPRMLTGFVNTAKTIGPNPYDIPLAGAANQIAAMPSLHVGWALLVALGVIWICSSKWRYFALLHPITTGAVVVITGNHYLTDIVVAVFLVGVSWLVWRDRNPNRLDGGNQYELATAISTKTD